MNNYTHIDIYTYTDAPNVLINNFGIKNPEKLDQLEEILSNINISSYYGYPKGQYDLKHLQTIHKYIFQDIYPWAGEIRQISISKGDTLFCTPSYIVSSYKKVHGDIIKANFLKEVKKPDLYKHLAYLHGEINAIHPFREGNGRSTRALISLIVNKSYGFHLNYECVNREYFIQASKDSLYLDYTKMENLYKQIIAKSDPNTQDYENNITNIQRSVPTKNNKERDRIVKDLKDLEYAYASNALEGYNNPKIQRYLNTLIKQGYTKDQCLAEILYQANNNLLTFLSQFD